MEQIKLDELEPAPWNPREIGEGELETLCTSIKRFSEVREDAGDGFRLVQSITVNRQNNRILGGNQRVKALRRLGQDWIDGRDITWVDIEPNTAIEETVCIALNHEGLMGKFTGTVFELLTKIEDGEPELYDLLSLFEIKVDEDFIAGEKVKQDAEIARLMQPEEEGPPGMELHPYESYDYLVVVFRNKLDWNFVIDLLEVKRVNSALRTGKKKIGIGRAIDGKKLISKLKGGSSYDSGADEGWTRVEPETRPRPLLADGDGSGSGSDEGTENPESETSDNTREGGEMDESHSERLPSI